jgi:hypothetical protein
MSASKTAIAPISAVTERFAVCRQRVDADRGQRGKDGQRQDVDLQSRCCAPTVWNRALLKPGSVAILSLCRSNWPIIGGKLQIAGDVLRRPDKKSSQEDHQQEPKGRTRPPCVSTIPPVQIGPAVIRFAAPGLSGILCGGSVAVEPSTLR